MYTLTTHFCEQCGQEIHGREDKRFCSEECRSRYHYEQKRRERLMQNRVFNQITSNYKLLLGLLKKGRCSSDLYALVDQGFNPAYITGHRRIRYGHDEYRCFDICYCQTPQKVFNIYKDEES